MKNLFVRNESAITRECAAALIVAEGNILLGKRHAGRSFYPGVWDIFGGHLKSGETPEAALRRELEKELGIAPTEWKILQVIDEPDPAQNGTGRYHLYLVTAWVGHPANLQPEEHYLIRWFRFDEAVRLKLAHPLYAELIERF